MPSIRSPMRILLTGASSFTGFWFFKTLESRGHQVVAPLPRKASAYSGLRAQRVDQLGNTHFDMPFGTPPFLNVLREQGPWDLLCCHGAHVYNYKSPDFDAKHAVAANTHELESVLKIADCSVLLTGTVFPSNTSPYGLSKTLTAQAFERTCQPLGIPLRHFIIPNPFGPWEDERFCFYLMRQWSQGRVAQVKTPDYVRDNIHAIDLARAYANHIDESTEQCSPSQYVGTQAEFVATYSAEVRQRLGWPCEYELLPQQDFSEPMQCRGTDPIAPADEAAAWDAIASYYQARFSHCGEKSRAI